MLTWTQVLTFLPVAMVLTATPGPDNLMVLSMGISRGRRAGMVFGLGCALGCLSHTALAVAGISALLVASPLAFTLLKWAGGAYLIYLGVGALRSRAGVRIPTQSADASVRLWPLFLRGLWANAINPKVVLFFLSFLPQFVQESQGHAGGQLTALGVLFTLQAALLFGVLGYFSGAVGAWLQGRPGLGPWLDRLTGVVFVGLGLRMLFAR